MYHIILHTIKDTRYMKFNLKTIDIIESDIVIPLLKHEEIEFFGKPISRHDVEFIRIYQSEYTMSEISDDFDISHPEETFYTDSMKLFRTPLAHEITKETFLEARKDI